MVRRSLRDSWWVPGLALLPGCFPVTWVLPPTQLEAGVGLSSSTSDPVDPTAVEPTPRTGGVVDVRGAISPLSAIPQFEERIVDVSAGYGLRYNLTGVYTTHGPFVGASALIPVTDTVGRRLVVGSQLHALIGERRGGYSVLGYRNSVRIGFEWSSWSEGPFNDCSFDGDGGFCGGGYSYGELGFTPYTEIARDAVLGRSEWAWTFGFSLRLPGSVGAGLVFINPATLL